MIFAITGKQVREAYNENKDIALASTSEISPVKDRSQKTEFRTKLSVTFRRYPHIEDVFRAIAKLFGQDCCVADVIQLFQAGINE